MGADDHCYERADLINNSARPCKALYGPCVTSAEQYFKRGLLGVHRSPLANITELVGVVHKYFCPQLVVFAWPNLVAFLLLQNKKFSNIFPQDLCFFFSIIKRVKRWCSLHNIFCHGMLIKGPRDFCFAVYCIEPTWHFLFFRSESKLK